MHRIRFSRIHTCVLAVVSTVVIQGATGLLAPAEAADLNLWPLLTVRTGEDWHDVRFLIPIGEFRERDGESVRAVRPLYIGRKKADGERSTDVLWPIFNVKRDGEGSTSGRAVPVFYGSMEDGRRWFHLAPVTWTWWHKEPHDEYDDRGVVVPPAYFTKEYASGHWNAGLIPVYAGWRGDDGHGGWVIPVLWHRGTRFQTTAILPLTCHYSENGTVRNWVVPVYWSREDGDLQTLVVFPFFWKGKTYTVLFPVYGQARGDGHQWTTVLWPCYLRSVRGDHKSHYVLWPLFHWKNGESGLNGLWVWPLFGWDREETDTRNSKHTWALWPVFWRGDTHNTWSREESSGSWRHHYAHAFPLLWTGDSTRTRVRKEEGSTRTETRYRNVFPLFWWEASRTCAIDADGNPTGPERHSGHNWLLPFYTYTRGENQRTLTCLWPVWRDTESDDMNHSQVFWRLFDARFESNGDHCVSVLWRGYRNEKEGESLEVDVFPFITYRRPEPGKNRFQFLAGFFELGKDGEDRHMRLFWLPKIPL